MHRPITGSVHAGAIDAFCYAVHGRDNRGARAIARGRFFRACVRYRTLAHAPRRWHLFGSASRPIIMLE